jgi:hypothetical protein
LLGPLLVKGISLDRLGELALAIASPPDAHPVGLRAPPGDDQHRQLGIEAVARTIGRADLAQHVDARRVGELGGQVIAEQQQVGLVIGAEAQGVGGTRG